MYGRLIASALLVGATFAWTDIPQPSVGLPDDDEVWIDIPDGDWSLEYAGFALVAIPEEDAVWEWADSLSAEEAWATPDGWVMVGEYAMTSAPEFGHGIGFGWGDAGNMKFCAEESVWTQNFDPENAVGEPLVDASWISKENAYDWPAGSGESWGVVHLDDPLTV